MDDEDKKINMQILIWIRCMNTKIYLTRLLVDAIIVAALSLKAA